MAVKARQGIPHLESVITAKGNKAPTLSEDQFDSLWDSNGFMTINWVTEKTDGQAWIVGYDDQGFFTKHSGSGDEKARRGTDHIRRAANRSARTGRPYDHQIYEAFSAFHNALHNTKYLIRYLSSRFDKEDVIIRGEAFVKRLAIVEKDTLTFNRIPYASEAIIGTEGMFVVHSMVPDNADHDFGQLLGCTNDVIAVDLDVYNFDPMLMTFKRSSAKNFDEQKAQLACDIEAAFCNNPLWGLHREGIIVHPDRGPTFKIIDKNFNNFKGKW